jgi:hypothetical protein
VMCHALQRNWRQMHRRARKLHLYFYVERVTD